MATFGTYYINAPDLISATSVFLNATLTTLAADAYYSDGTIVRRQLSGVLLSPEACPSCQAPCNTTFSVVGGGTGLYKISVDVGTSYTNVAIRGVIDVAQVPDGFRAVWGGSYYNQLSSTSGGYLNNYSGTPSSTTLPVYIGLGTAPCPTASLPCPSPCAAFANMATYEYDGGVWLSTAPTDWAINASEMQFTPFPLGPGPATFIIPKTTAQSTVDIEIYGLCPGTVWSITIDCATALPATATTGYSAASSVAACAAGAAATVYRGKVNGSDALPGLYDWVFTTPNGSTLVAAGFYKYVDGVNKWFEVSADGVIVTMGTC